MQKLTYQQQVIREEWEKGKQLHINNMDTNGNRIINQTFDEVEHFAKKAVERLIAFVDPRKITDIDLEDYLWEIEDMYGDLIRITLDDFTKETPILPSNEFHFQNDLWNEAFGTSGIVYKTKEDTYAIERISLIFNDRWKVIGHIDKITDPTRIKKRSSNGLKLVKG